MGAATVEVTAAARKAKNNGRLERIVNCNDV
jgi:hypothetical protein